MEINTRTPGGMKRLAVAVALLVLAVSMTPFTVSGLTFGSAATVLVDWNDNLFPSLLQRASGDVWLAYQKSSAASADDIYLMVNNGFGWGSQLPLITGPLHDVTPSLVELRNGTIIMVWPSKRAADYDLYTMSYTRDQWSSPTLLTQGLGDDFNPALVRAHDGRVWMVWSRSTLANGGGDLYYRIFNGISWGPEQALVTGLYEEKFPAITQARDRRIWVVWESNSAGNARINYKIFDGTTWTSTVPLTLTNDNDKWPSIAQDRSGTIWIFWSRELHTNDPTRPFQWDLFYKSSTTNGATWSLDTALFPEDATDDWHPSLAQGRDRSLWLVWNSDRPSLYGTHNLYLVKTDTVTTHDLSVSITLPQDKPRSGQSFTGTVRVDNLGDFTESATLTVTIDGSTIGSTPILLAAGQNANNTYTWPTTNRPLGQHTFQATVNQVAGETIPWDNSATTKFHIVPEGDVERNGVVSVIDLSILGASFASQAGQALYNPHADLNSNGSVDIIDMATVGRTFGQQANLPPDFYLSASRYYVQLTAGSSLDVMITVGQIAGLSTPVLLSATGFGSGVTATLSTHLVGPPGSSTLRFEAQSNPSVGTFTVTITGTNGTLTRSLTITLVIA